MTPLHLGEATAGADEACRRPPQGGGQLLYRARLDRAKTNGPDAVRRKNRPGSLRACRASRDRKHHGNRNGRPPATHITSYTPEVRRREWVRRLVTWDRRSRQADRWCRRWQPPLRTRARSAHQGEHRFLSPASSAQARRPSEVARFQLGRRKRAGGQRSDGLAPDDVVRRCLCRRR